MSSSMFSSRVDCETYEGIMWGSVALTLGFVIFRIYARLTVFGRIFVDDYLVILAWVMILIQAIVEQINLPFWYALIDTLDGRHIPSIDFLAELEGYMHSLFATYFLFFSSLWCIKFSFLAFFLKLGHHVRGQYILWWTVTVITVCLYISCLGTFPYACATGPIEKILAYCDSGQAQAYQHVELKFAAGVDVSSDGLILLIPITLLWHAQMSLKKKFVMGAIFGLTILIMIVAIIRISLLLEDGAVLDTSWLSTLSHVEQAIAIIVACLASFRTLYANIKDTPNKYNNKSLRDHRIRLSKYGLFIEDDLGVSTLVSSQRREHIRRESFTSSGEISILPLDAIHIRHEIRQDR